MGFTRQEFDRILPSALDDRDFEVKGNVVSSNVDGGCMILTISEQKSRKIASLSLPYLDVDFSFERLTQAQIEPIMRFFELRYQRGGG